MAKRVLQETYRKLRKSGKTKEDAKRMAARYVKILTMREKFPLLNLVELIAIQKEVKGPPFDIVLTQLARAEREMTLRHPKVQQHIIESYFQSTYFGKMLTRTKHALTAVGYTHNPATTLTELKSYFFPTYRKLPPERQNEISQFIEKNTKGYLLLMTAGATLVDYRKRLSLTWSADPEVMAKTENINRLLGEFSRMLRVKKNEMRAVVEITRLLENAEE